MSNQVTITVAGSDRFINRMLDYLYGAPLNMPDYDEEYISEVLDREFGTTEEQTFGPLDDSVEKAGLSFSEAVELCVETGVRVRRPIWNTGSYMWVPKKSGVRNPSWLSFMSSKGAAFVIGEEIILDSEDVYATDYEVVS